MVGGGNRVLQQGGGKRLFPSWIAVDRAPRELVLPEPCQRQLTARSGERSPHSWPRLPVVFPSQSESPA